MSNVHQCWRFPVGESEIGSLLYIIINVSAQTPFLKGNGLLYGRHFASLSQTITILQVIKYNSNQTRTFW